MAILRKLNRLINSIKIKNRVILSYIILIVLSLTFVVLFTWNKIDNLVVKRTEEILAESIIKTSDYMHYEIGVAINSLNNINVQSNVEKLISSNPERLSYIEQYALYTELKRFFDREVNLSNVSAIRVYVQEGFYFSNQNVYFFNLNEFKKTPEYEAIRDNNGIVYPYLLPKEQAFSHQDVLMFSRAVMDPSSKVVLGVISVELQIKDINSTLATANLIDAGQVFLVDSNGSIVAGKTDNSNPQPQENIQKILSGKELSVQSVSIKQQTIRTGYRNLGYFNWAVVLLLPFEQSDQQVINLMMQFIMLILAVLVLGFVLAYLSFLSVIRRLDRLKNKMNDVKNLQFVLTEVDGNDEITDLQRSYNFMVQKVNALLDENYFTGKKAKSSELKALQSQINPHFLYNTLDFIKWSAKCNNMIDISEFVVKLSKFYRISLGGGKSLVTLEKELEHCQLYLNLINMRYKNCVSLRMDISEDSMKCLLPKILLQPIVENSVMHGILEKESGKGEIVISARKGSDELILTIADDGVGIQTDMLKILCDKTVEKVGSYGLKNTDERIRLEFGEQYGLSFEKSAVQGTTVIIHLGLRYELDER